MNSISLAARDSMSLLLDMKYYSGVIYSTFLTITLKVQFCLPRYDSDHIFAKINWPKFQRELNVFFLATKKQFAFLGYSSFTLALQVVFQVIALWVEHFASSLSTAYLSSVLTC